MVLKYLWSLGSRNICVQEGSRNIYGRVGTRIIYGHEKNLRYICAIIQKYFYGLEWASYIFGYEVPRNIYGH